MANYVVNRVICRKEILDRYLIDYNPFGDGRSIPRPYITFNRLFDAKSLDEYSEKYGVTIAYNWSFLWNELSNGLYEIKFYTRWEYPIRAILRALEVSHDTVWFACEENHIYVSKFYWSGGVKEDVLHIENDYYEWEEKNPLLFDTLEDGDDDVWYFLQGYKGTWKNWESHDGFKRYLDTSAINVKRPAFFEKE